MITRCTIEIERFDDPELARENADYIAVLRHPDNVGRGTVVSAGSLPDVLKEMAISVFVLEEHFKKGILE